ncbi:hypothetical protein AX15_002079 [Amanita polypyramis BW_CC]|nr:hypothetical protein AX15_002079 [Amanita polypyramis BW_CC]
MPAYPGEGAPDYQQRKEILVIGAGVIGLSTAIKIQEKGGYNVSIISEIFPTDPKDTRYTSHFAGAQFVSSASTRDDIRQRRIEKESYDVFQRLSEPGGATEQYFLRLQQTEFYSGKNFKLPYYEEFPGYRVLGKDELLPETDAGLTFESFTIDTPRYVNYLMSRFLGSGGTMIRGTVQHMSQLVEGGANGFRYGSLNATRQAPDGILVCTGLGARVEDKQMIPVRGQTVLIRAPWVRFGKSISDDRGSWTYVIPRRSGDVILGGTKNPNTWDTAVWKDTSRDILERTLRAFPEIAPPEIREKREPTVEDIIPLVLEENVGFRPTNPVNGLRLQVDLLESVNGRPKVPVVYNYGHGGYGFIMSWGSANIALELLEDALANREM